MKIKIIGSIIWGLSFLLGQSSFPGLNSWYQAESVMLSGVGQLLTTGLSAFNNPALLTDLPPRFSINLVRYPADISAESFSINGKKGDHFFGLKLLHLGYGVFKGKDENNQSTGDYTSGDTQLRISYARGHQLSIGLSGGIFLSRLEKTTAAIFTVSPGAKLRLKNNWGLLGFSLENIGWLLSNYGDTQESIPTVLYFSYSKSLSNLPMEIALDLFSEKGTPYLHGGISGILQISRDFRIKFGSTTRKWDQQTHITPLKDMLGDTGIGLSYVYQDITLDTGVYFYGPGGIIFAIGFGVRF